MKMAKQNKVAVDSVANSVSVSSASLREVSSQVNNHNRNDVDDVAAAANNCYCRWPLGRPAAASARRQQTLYWPFNPQQRLACSLFATIIVVLIVNSVTAQMEIPAPSTSSSEAAAASTADAAASAAASIVASPSKTVLVTGGAGYIGSHCVVALLERDFSVVVIDNLINSVQLPNTELPESIARAQILSKKNITQFYKGDMGDVALLEQIFNAHKIDAVLHFAALKAVSESVSKPLEYFRNNVGSTLTLLYTMNRFGVKKMIFSSSATVYGTPQYLPLDEKHPTGSNISNPYGRGKAMVETILNDLASSDPEWSIISLRYFNPIGAHISGLIGEDPADIPNNLMPFITQVAVGRRKELSVFGSDYNTVDGTPIRDYIHIDDLITGHIAALERMHDTPTAWQGFHPLNLGTGSGTTVLQMISSFQNATGIEIPHKIAPRRAGDVPSLCADASKANSTLQWTAHKSLQEACASSWRWQSQNPNGYRP